MFHQDRGCDVVSRIDPFFVHLRSLPYKVWHFKHGTGDGPMGYLPFKSCTSQAQLQWAGAFVSSSLFGEALVGLLTECMGRSRESPRGSSALAVVVREGVCANAQKMSVHFGTVQFGTVGSVALLVGGCGRAGTSVIASQKLPALMGNPIWMERCVRASAIDQLVPDLGTVNGYAVTFLVGMYLICWNGSFQGFFKFSGMVRGIQSRIRVRLDSPMRWGGRRWVRPWHLWFAMFFLCTSPATAVHTDLWSMFKDRPLPKPFTPSSNSSGAGSSGGKQSERYRA